MGRTKLEPVSDDPTKVRLRAGLAWGAEGVRVDLYDHEGARRYAWELTWADMAALVSKGSHSPVARASAEGVEFLALDSAGHLLIARWTWDELVERAMVSASPVDPEP